LAPQLDSIIPAQKQARSWGSWGVDCARLFECVFKAKASSVSLQLLDFLQYQCNRGVDFAQLQATNTNEAAAMTPKSAKEKARTLRQKAYQEAKERRKSDPKYLALKEKLKEKSKEMRRASYQRQKDAIKARKTALKKQEREKKSQEKNEQAAKLVAELAKDKKLPVRHLRLVQSTESDS